MNTKIYLFGVFRSFIPEGHLDINIFSEIKVLMLKELILARLREQVPEFSKDSLVFESAVANRKKIFADDEVISCVDDLALLPPVCGG